MTLHEAIEKILKRTNRPMTAKEIAHELNNMNWYKKRDNSKIKPGQITARVNNNPNLFEVDHSVKPLEINLANKHSVSSKRKKVKKNQDFNKPENSSTLKKSFDPISDANTRILILGSMPGEKSLQIGEYYANPGNKFWKIIAKITDNQLPATYPEKKDLLFKTGIGIWDVAHTVNRQGSLDSAIKDEEPNNLNTFIANHKNLKVIGFNGQKPEKLYDKHFDRKKGIKYFSLPSTSPANTHFDFERICQEWKKILE